MVSAVYHELFSYAYYAYVMLSVLMPVSDFWMQCRPLCDQKTDQNVQLNLLHIQGVRWDNSAKIQGGKPRKFAQIIQLMSFAICRIAA